MRGFRAGSPVDEEGGADGASGGGDDGGDGGELAPRSVAPGSPAAADAEGGRAEEELRRCVGMLRWPLQQEERSRFFASLEQRGIAREGGLERVPEGFGRRVLPQLSRRRVLHGYLRDGPSRSSHCPAVSARVHLKGHPQKAEFLLKEAARLFPCQGVGDPGPAHGSCGTLAYLHLEGRKFTVV